MNLSGKVALITGANQGLGYEIARHFVSQGASVMLCARDEEKLIKVKNDLSLLIKNKNLVCIQKTDISDYDQVNHLIEKTILQFKKIDIFVANAGIYGTKGHIDEVNWFEWSKTIDINLKGAVLCTQCILPFMKKNKKGKIIFISGGGATKPMPGLSAYAASKAAIVRFAETLAEELRPFNIDVNAVAPGALNTRLLDEALTAGPKKIGEKFYQQLLKQKQEGGTALSIGAELCVFLASTNSDGITGKLISAVWDPWKKLPDYLEELKQTDIYTLRRIVPADRGKKWEAVS